MKKAYYRIFDEKNDAPHTLFHGVKGSRKLPLDTWVEAEIRKVKDGSCKVKYISGFHVLKTEQEAKSFLNKMFKYKNYRVITRVLVDEDSGLWKKEHSKSNVFLAKKIKILKKDWKNRKHLV